MQLFIKNKEIHFINDVWNFQNQSYTKRLYFNEKGFLIESELGSLVQDNGDILYQEYDDENQSWCPTHLGKTTRYIVLRYDATKCISPEAIRELFSDAELKEITYNII